MPDLALARDLARQLVEALGVGFDRAAFVQRYTNRRASAISHGDIQAAAALLGVTTGHVDMLRKVESGGRSFDGAGRPIILFEPHIFSRLTEGRFDKSHPDLSYPKWGAKPYPSGNEAQWERLTGAAELDESAALQSCSWGLFQVMGFNWRSCGYASVGAFAAAMAEDEDNHLEAMIAYVDARDLEDDLRRCRAGDPDSCRAFAAGYNGAGYARHGYHIKMAEALA